MHGACRTLLDDEFISAYEHGMVNTRSDGITRRIYTRIFTYSADYPEKYLTYLYDFECSTHLVPQGCSSYDPRLQRVSLPEMSDIAG